MKLASASTSATAAPTSPASWMWRTWRNGRARTCRTWSVARDYKFMCSSLGQELIEKDIKEQGLTRVVVAACSPHLHETTFRSACQRAGLNPYLCELVSIREQVSWVLTDRAAATEKAKAIISGGVRARDPSTSRWSRILVPIHPNCWSSAAASPASRLRWRSPTAASPSTWWSASHPSAGTWPSSTRPSPPWTAPPAS